MFFSSPKDVLAVIISELFGNNNSRTTLFQYQYAVYSAASMHALTSLYESSSKVTSSVILGNIKKVVEALDFGKWYKNLVQTDLLTQDLTPRNIEDVILDIYRRAGFFYQREDRLFLSEYKEVSVNGIAFIRGTGYQQNLRMSGAGIYKIDEESESEPSRLRDMFLIPQNSNADFNSCLISNSVFTESKPKNDMEYFNPFFKSNADVWIKENLFIDEEVSFLRVNEKNQYRYYLYKTGPFANKIFICPIDNEVFYSIFKRFVWDICSKFQQENVITYAKANELILVKIPSFMPDEEMTFLSLYSWQRTDKGIFFERLFVPRVFDAIKITLEEIGYVFKRIDISAI